MFQASELAIPIWLKGEDHTPQLQGQLYVRFSVDGVFCWLKAGGVQIQTKGFHQGHYLNAFTEEILPQIPGIVVEQRHSAWFLPAHSQSTKVLELRETAKLDTTGGDVHFKVHANCDGQEFAGEGTEFDIAMDRFLSCLPGQLSVCYTCALADYMSYGGEDLRHGWNCFRDLHVDPSTWDQWWEHEDEFRLAIHQMSAFHWCPSYRNRADNTKNYR